MPGKSKSTVGNDAYGILSSTPFKSGDVVFLDFDETLVFAGPQRLKPVLAHPKLPTLLNTLQNQGVICIGLTARSRGSEISQQLSALGISFYLAQSLFERSSFPDYVCFYQNGIFYSESKHTPEEKVSTKGATAVHVLERLRHLDSTRFEENGLKQNLVARRIVVLDDLQMNLDAVKHCVNEAETYLIQRNALFVSNRQDATKFPSDLSKLRFVRHLTGGSGGVYVLKDDETCILYTFKAHQNLNHLKEELLSDALYQAVGCAVPDFVVVSEIPPCLEGINLPGNGVYRLAKFIETNQEKNNDLIKQELTRHFLVDALFSNWDVSKNDNVILDNNNTLYRIDNGGALRYRSIQGLKQQEYKHWSASHVDELETLSRSQGYGHLTPQDLEKQHLELLKHADAIFATLAQLDEVLHIDNVEELQSFIAARLYDLDIRLRKSSHPYAKAFESVSADEKHNSASLFIMSTVNGIRCVLLGQRNGHDWYGDFGGKADRADGTLFVTAAREALEETAHKVRVSMTEIESCSSHDLITVEEGGTVHTHRMFFIEHEYLPEQILLDAVNQDSTHAREIIRFAWVPITALLDAITDQTPHTVENQETRFVHYISPETEKRETISLFPPMAKMLQQEPVKEILSDTTGKKLSLGRRTRSHADVTYQDFQTIPRVLYSDVGGYVQTRSVRYHDQLIIQEKVYPDPMAERRMLIRTTVVSTELNKTKLLKHIQAKRPASLYKHEPEVKQHPTQTVAHLQGMLSSQEPDPVKLVENFLTTKMPLSEMAVDPHVKTLLCDATKTESTYPNHVVLYHATCSYLGFFYDFISTLRSLLVMEDIRSLRAFDDVFKEIPDVEAFVDEQCRKQGVARQEINNYKNDYQEKGLSCNFSLFGNYDNGGSSTIGYLHSNKSSGYLVNSYIDMVLDRLNINSVSKQEFHTLYTKHLKDLGGHLYQIFIDRNQVDNLCYFSDSGGKYHPFATPWKTGMKPEEQHKLLPVIDALRQSPNDFLDNPELKKHSLQARLYMHPRMLHDTDVVKVISYKNQENPQVMQNELSILAQTIVRELLQKKQGLQLNYQGSIQGKAGLTRLQRKYAFVSRGVTKQEIQYGDGGFHIETLFKHIDSGNVTAFEHDFALAPEEFDFSQVINYSLNAEPMSVLQYAILCKRTEIVKLFLDSKHCTEQCLMCSDKFDHYLHANSKTILMHAIHNDAPDIVQLLLENRHCTPDYLMTLNNVGHTALIEAANQYIFYHAKRDVSLNILMILLDGLLSKGKLFFLKYLRFENVYQDEYRLCVLSHPKEYEYDLRLRSNILEEDLESGKIYIHAEVINRQLSELTYTLKQPSGEIRNGTIKIKELLRCRYSSYLYICNSDNLLKDLEPYTSNIINIISCQGHIQKLERKTIYLYNKDENFLIYKLLDQSENVVYGNIKRSTFQSPSLAAGEITPESLENYKLAILKITSEQGQTRKATAFVSEGFIRSIVPILKSFEMVLEDTKGEGAAQTLVTHRLVSFLSETDGDTALIVAASHGCCNLAKILLESHYGTSDYTTYVNPKHGNTALMLAIKHDQPEIVRILMESGHYKQEHFNQLNRNGDSIFTLTYRNENMRNLLGIKPVQLKTDATSIITDIQEIKNDSTLTIASNTPLLTATTSSPPLTSSQPISHLSVNNVQFDLNLSSPSQGCSENISTRTGPPENRLYQQPVLNSIQPLEEETTCCCPSFYRLVPYLGAFTLTALAIVITVLTWGVAAGLAGGLGAAITGGACAAASAEAVALGAATVGFAAGLATFGVFCWNNWNRGPELLSSRAEQKFENGVQT